MTITPSRPAIAAAGLRKSFGDQVVLDGLDLVVPPGTVFALLGPNGAGKTTAVKILSTLLSADAGDVQVAGHDLAREPDAVRAAIGVTGQFSAVDNLLTGQENLLLMADLHHLARGEGRRCAARLLEQFDLTEAGRRAASTYSGGMRRRLDLAMTLVGRPQVVFLDEPTAGLDPPSRRNMWRCVRDLVASGVTIFLTTQYLEEADELKRRIPGGHVRLRFADPEGLDAATSTLGEGERDDAALTLRLPGSGHTGATAGRAAYANYVAPAIMLMTVTATVQGTAISVAMDLTEGIIDRFRTMHIARVSVLTRHVLGSVIQAVVSLAIVTGVALLAGFRPTAGLGGWLAAAGFLVVVTFALVWLCVALGQVSKSVETASNLPMPLVLLPFGSSGFVPTDSMPAGLRWFAEYQPFTPVIETLRGLLTDKPLGNNAWIALLWCAVIALGGYLWSKRLFNRESSR